MSGRFSGAWWFLGGMPKPLFSFALVAGLSVAACSPTNIANTDVEDTSENRKVINFCEDYRHAVEEKNVGLLLKYASEKYYEDGGNTNAEDDLDYAGLRDYLTTTFQKATAVRYEIRYRRVTFTQSNKIYVDYTYSASYRIPGVKTPNEWRHTIADNRLVLEPQKDETFKILAGM